MLKIFFVLGVTFLSTACGGRKSPDQPGPSPPNGTWHGVVVDAVSSSTFVINLKIKQIDSKTLEASDINFDGQQSCFGVNPYFSISKLEQIGPFSQTKLEMWPDSTKTGRYFSTNIIFNQFFTYADGSCNITNSPSGCANITGRFSMSIMSHN